MPVQFRSAARRSVYNDYRDGGVVVVTLDLVGILAVSRVGQVDDTHRARIAIAFPFDV
jgi:hypothetical protein